MKKSAVKAPTVILFGWFFFPPPLKKKHCETEGACVCVCVLDGEGSRMLAGRALAVVKQTAV